MLSPDGREGSPRVARDSWRGRGSALLLTPPVKDLDANQAGHSEVLAKSGANFARAISGLLDCAGGLLKLQWHRQPQTRLPRQKKRMFPEQGWAEFTHNSSPKLSAGVSSLSRQQPAFLSPVQRHAC